MAKYQEFKLLKFPHIDINLERLIALEKEMYKENGHVMARELLVILVSYSAALMESETLNADALNNSLYNSLLWLDDILNGHEN